MQDRPNKLFLVWSRSAGRYTSLCSLLHERGWTVLMVQDAKNLSALDGTRTGKLTCLAVLDATSNFSQEEIDEIAQFISSGNGALIAQSASSQDGSPLQTNVNELVQPYGIEFSDDCVIRLRPYKLYHPKEAMLEDFMVHIDLDKALKRRIAARSDRNSGYPEDRSASSVPRIIYPRGCTLIVAGDVEQGDTSVVTTSSRWALPSELPICAVHSVETEAESSKVVVLGSARLLSDEYIEKEDNRSFVECLIELFSSSGKPITSRRESTIEDELATE